LLDTVWSFLLQHSYAVVFVVTVIDATGTPFPGRLLLIAAGALAAAGHANVVAMIAAATAGAVIGDHVWYVLGRWRGQALIDFGCRITLRSRDCASRANELVRRFGALAIVIGRFFTAVRIFVTAVVAGSGMSYAKYLLSETVGSLIWSSIFILLGYGTGGYLRRALADHDSATLWSIAAVVAVAVVGGVVAYRLFRRASPTT
jgi:membrane-associated protein